MLEFVYLGPESGPFDLEPAGQGTLRCRPAAV